MLGRNLGNEFLFGFLSDTDVFVILLRQLVCCVDHAFQYYYDAKRLAQH